MLHSKIKASLQSTVKKWHCLSRLNDWRKPAYVTREKYNQKIKLTFWLNRSKGQLFFKTLKSIHRLIVHNRSIHLQYCWNHKRSVFTVLLHEVFLLTNSIQFQEVNLISTTICTFISSHHKTHKLAVYTASLIITGVLHFWCITSLASSLDRGFFVLKRAMHSSRERCLCNTVIQFSELKALGSFLSARR